MIDGKISDNECVEFLEKPVDVGTKHHTIPDRIFYNTGVLKGVYKDTLKLKTRLGYRIIPLCEVLEIRIAKGSDIFE